MSSTTSDSSRSFACSRARSASVAMSARVGSAETPRMSAADRRVCGANRHCLDTNRFHACPRRATRNGRPKRVREH
jgi:hypothetical protein